MPSIRYSRKESVGHLHPDRSLSKFCRRSSDFMSPRKLTESEKVDIINTYRQTPETTSTLATRYSVSNSTISRLLKARLPASEYENLVQQKRAAAGKGKMPAVSMPPPKENNEPAIATFPDPTPEPVVELTSELDAMIPESGKQTVVHPPIPGLTLDPDGAGESESLEDEKEDEKEKYLAQASTLRELLGEDLDEEDEDDLDEEDENDDELDESEAFPFHGERPAQVEVRPLSEAQFPRTCYLVIDHGAELITRPLKEFAELGQIPVSEVTERTLPIFDNHRVARRFSRRSQRVIKVPDSRMLPKTSPYLYAKGITRLLFDGRVYSLSDR
ncbi:hypothetical protein [Roseofilum casamattae]|uniref:Transposase n=1 Tax=Roseofilum casamattae BLCC-M143 TaxID=3022442 RepID=A0ABT7BZ74_9CYAN|nr:hypothetical protein [Roseofilum casamattae]MDJ1184502.1 transposase [Roseofilum casamattae BLCC-M143]